MGLYFVVDGDSDDVGVDLYSNDGSLRGLSSWMKG
jgi:hypothetical protein